jgi:hypothetical protein
MLGPSFLIVMLNPFMLSVAIFIVMLIVIMLNAVMLSVVMLYVERDDCRGAEGRADILGEKEFG